MGYIIYDFYIRRIKGRYKYIHYETEAVGSNVAEDYSSVRGSGGRSHSAAFSWNSPLVHM